MKITSVPTLPQGSGVQGINQQTTHESPTPALPVVKEEPKLEEQLSSKYADWAKKEKLLRSKIQASEEALKKREEAIQAKEAEYEKNYVPRSRVAEVFQKDPTNALKEFGLSGDQLTHALLNQPSPQDLKIQQLEAEVAALKGYPDQTKKLLEDRDKQAYDTALHQMKFDLQKFVEKDPQYELIRNNKAHESVAQLIQDVFEKGSEKLNFPTGHLLQFNEACDLVEKELEEQIWEAAQSEKIKSRFQTPAPVVVKDAAPNKLAVKTLTHSQAPAAQKPLSPRDRAILAFEGKLT